MYKTAGPGITNSTMLQLKTMQARAAKEESTCKIRRGNRRLVAKIFRVRGAEFLNLTPQLLTANKVDFKARDILKTVSGQTDLTPLGPRSETPQRLE
jgi:hypothetical protein